MEKSLTEKLRRVYQKCFDADTRATFAININFFLFGWDMGLSMILIGLMPGSGNFTFNFWLVLSGVILIFLGPLYCHITKKRVSLDDIRFKITFWSETAIIFFLYFLWVIVPQLLKE